MSTTDFSLSSFTRYAREAGFLGQNFQSIRSVKKFSGGQSNFTYLIDTGERQLVLRKQPNGILRHFGQAHRLVLVLVGAGMGKAHQRLHDARYALGLFEDLPADLDDFTVFFALPAGSARGMRYR